MGWGNAIGALVGGVATVLAAPVVLPYLGTAGLLGAAGTGTAISSLSGAALISASCASITGTIAGSQVAVGIGGAVAGASFWRSPRRRSLGRRRYSIEGIATACAVARSVGSLDELMRTKEGRKAWAKFVDLTCEMVQQVGTEKTVKFYFGLPTS